MGGGGSEEAAGGCSSPFMNSQAPMSSPDSAAILSERRSGEGRVVARGGHPPPGAAPVPGSRGARGPEHRAGRREAAGAEGGGGSGVSAPGAPGTFRGEPEPAPRGAHTPRAVAAPIGTRLPPLLRRPRRAGDTQRRSHGRAEGAPGSRGDHGAAAVRPRSRPWRLARPRAGLRGPGLAAAAPAPPAPPPLSGNSSSSSSFPPGPAPRPSSRPPSAPPLSGLRGHPLKGPPAPGCRPPAPVARRPAGHLEPVAKALLPSANGGAGSGALGPPGRGAASGPALDE